jgi:CubicO group peptidase (beta-lactamase class C family)
VGLSEAHLSRIDAVATAHVENPDESERIAGAVVLVGCDGNVVYEKAFGYRAMKPSLEPMTVDSIFDLASLTKPIATSTALMKLVENGELRLENTLGEALPTHGRHGKAAITLEQLLRHRSGLVSDNPLSDYRDGVDRAWERIADLPLLSNPGEKFTYSDVNFLILGRIVSERTGGLDSFCNQTIFRPLEMRDTRFFSADDDTPPETTARVVPTVCDEAGEMLRCRVHDPRARALGGVAGHAGLFGTANDLALFCQMLLNDGVGANGVRVLTRESVQSMTSAGQMPEGERRGLGWDIDTPYSTPRGTMGAKSFGHTGFTGTSVWVDPATRSFVIVLTSRLHPDGKGVSPTRLRRLVGEIAGSAFLAERNDESGESRAPTGSKR